MRSTLVLGASLKSNRYSHLAVERLVEKGIETMAYGLRPGSILGVEVKTNFVLLFVEPICFILT